MVHTDLRLREALLAVAVLVSGAGLAGCVEAYGGANLQIDFSREVQLPSGSDDTNGRVPGDTYFTFYATDAIVDEDGAVVNHVFEVVRFEIRSVIDPTSPCFIELEDAEFPGLHVTRYAEKKREAICANLGQNPDCFPDPFNPPNGASENDVIDVISADTRMGKLPLYQGGIKSVVTFSNFDYPAAAADCNVSGDEIPAPTCIDNGSNAQRLRVCNELWAANPDRYEGSDKVFTLPLNGAIRGMVEGANPANGAPIGGSQIYVDSTLSGFESFAVNYQFKDHDGDGAPDYPANWLDTHEESVIGYSFLAGEPESITRGVISAHLSTPYDPDIPFNAGIFAEVAIFAEIGEDNVSF